ncbi:hypothetical protein AS9A_3186 [Hoyosella subflava DQS3-9A1]|uniref:Uncharacterized protein n=1 Tax=Hoyosella subflava (strain DSM 45089 / JCM 17490 / NBRC 109087 / DQS3-9A1) TaxID=443218 RepID=F6EMS3_HOYSD|nr:hypothetical protein AS9A_3186 [Hoyosella subflava DQS3-9A1]
MVAEKFPTRDNEIGGSADRPAHEFRSIGVLWDEGEKW